MKAKRLLALARRHAQSGLSASCSHGPGSPPCDAALLAAEVARVRAWADFASDLLDAHLWGFGSGDWQAADALAHIEYGEDWPPDWRRDPDDAARIVVEEDSWPVSGLPRKTDPGALPTRAHRDWLAAISGRRRGRRP